MAIKRIILLLMLSSGLFAQAPLVHKIGKPKTNFVTPIQTSLVNEPNCVFATNGTKIGNTVVDISGNGNTGTAIGGVVASGGIENGLQFNGTSSYVSVADANSLDFGTSPFTIEADFIHVQKASGYVLFSKDAGAGQKRLFAYVGAGSTIFDFYMSDGTNTYAASYPLIDGRRYHLTISVNRTSAVLYLNGILTSPSASTGTVASIGDISSSVAMSIGGLTNSYFYNKIIYSLKLYNVALTATQVKERWNKLASKPYIIEDFSDGTVGKFPRDWTKISGTHTVQQLATAEGYLKAGTKYLRCDANGILAFKSDQAYGRWSFDVYKGGVANLLYFSFISNATTNTNGYKFWIINDRSIALLKVASGDNYLNKTASPYIENNTWYHIDIERTTAGVFSVYITGGAFTTKTLVSTVGGIGSNPVTDNTYTTSKWFVLDLDANDRITNIKMWKGIPAL